MVYDFIRDVARYVDTVGQDTATGMAVLDELKDKYEHVADRERHVIRFWDESIGMDQDTGVTVGIPGLPALAHAYNQASRASDEQERVRTYMEDNYYYIGTVDTSFFSDKSNSYVLDEDAYHLDRVDRLQEELELGRAIEGYRTVREIGDVADAQAMWNVIRDLYREGEIGSLEVFYDDLRNRVYVFDRGDITLTETDPRIVTRMDVLDASAPRPADIDLESDKPVFQQLLEAANIDLDENT